MPFSFDPQPEDNETQCARCSAIFHLDLTRCPECGVNLYEPDEEYEPEHHQEFSSPNPSIFSKIGDLLRRVFGKPYTADEIFGDSLDQALLYDDLLRKVGSDKNVVDRLIQFEQQQNPTGNRSLWLQSAIQRWNRDNRTNTTGKQ